MTSRLSSLLVQDSLVSAKRMADAFQRQVIYGGTLDTNLLEMRVVEEDVLVTYLGRASGLPTQPSGIVAQGKPVAKVLKAFPPDIAERFRAVPTESYEAGVLRVLVSDPVEPQDMEALAQTVRLRIEPWIVPEFRIVEAMEAVYGAAMPPRFMRLLTRSKQSHEGKGFPPPRLIDPLPRFGNLHDFRLEASIPGIPSAAIEALMDLSQSAPQPVPAAPSTPAAQHEPSGPTMVMPAALVEALTSASQATPVPARPAPEQQIYKAPTEQQRPRAQQPTPRPEPIQARYPDLGGDLGEEPTVVQRAPGGLGQSVPELISEKSGPVVLVKTPVRGPSPVAQQAAAPPTPIVQQAEPAQVAPQAVPVQATPAVQPAPATQRTLEPRAEASRAVLSAAVQKEQPEQPTPVEAPAAAGAERAPEPRPAAPPSAATPTTMPQQSGKKKKKRRGEAPRIPPAGPIIAKPVIVPPGEATRQVSQVAQVSGHSYKAASDPKLVIEPSVVVTDLPHEVSTAERDSDGPVARLPQEMPTPPGGRPLEAFADAPRMTGEHTPLPAPMPPLSDLSGPAPGIAEAAPLTGPEASKTTTQQFITPLPAAASAFTAEPVPELIDSGRLGENLRPGGAPLPRVVASGDGRAAAMSFDAAKELIAKAEERDVIFEALCRAARSRVAFAAVFTVHGDVAFGRMALGEDWLDRQGLGKVAVPLDRPSAFRIAVKGRSPFVGRLGDQPAAGEPLAAIGRKPPLSGAVLPILVRGRPVALLYLDDAGRELKPSLTDELRATMMEVSQAFQRLVLRSRAGGFDTEVEDNARDRRVQQELLGTTTSSWPQPPSKDKRQRPTEPPVSAVPVVVHVKDSDRHERSPQAPKEATEQPTTRLRVDASKRGTDATPPPGEIKAPAAEPAAKATAVTEVKATAAKTTGEIKAGPRATSEVKAIPGPKGVGEVKPATPGPRASGEFKTVPGFKAIVDPRAPGPKATGEVKAVTQGPKATGEVKAVTQGPKTSGEQRIAPPPPPEPRAAKAPQKAEPHKVEPVAAKAEPPKAEPQKTPEKPRADLQKSEPQKIAEKPRVEPQKIAERPKAEPQRAEAKADIPRSSAPVAELLAKAAAGDEVAAAQLAAAGEAAARAWVDALPGALTSRERQAIGDPIGQPVTSRGPLLGLLPRIGMQAVPALLARLAEPKTSAEVRYYLTLCLGELPAESALRPLGERLFDEDDAVRMAAVTALRSQNQGAALRELLETLRSELIGPDTTRQRYAADALGELRDGQAVPRLIPLLGSKDLLLIASSTRALQSLTKQDFGRSHWRWRSWYRKHQAEPRLQWLLSSLSHPSAAMRAQAQDELRGLAGDAVGYRFDLPRRERDQAQSRWVEWWQRRGYAVHPH